jgi:tripartite-type tricarboxylate transporter receptor subunit TctC
MDIMYRNVAQRLTPLLGQNVLVENRPGANGSVSAIYVASQVPADGHTLLVLPSFMATINPHLYKDATVDYDRDFVNVGGVTDTRFVVMVPSSLGITTLKQFVDEARAKPGTFNFASGGNGSIAHLVFERFRTEQRLEIEHVPYKGTGPAVPDFLAGRIHLMIDNYNQLKAHVERGAVKVLAVANTERMKAIPDVPTTAEAGFPNLLAIGWSSLMAPAKVPEAALARLRKAVRRVAEDPDFAEYMESIGAAARWREPEELLQLTRREREFWGAFIRNHGIQVT